MNHPKREELEDTRDDVLAKAFAMAGLSPCPLPSSPPDKRNRFLKDVLHLSPPAFDAMTASITPPALPSGLTRHILPFAEWTLNIWTLDTSEGQIAIDTGLSPSQLGEAVGGTPPIAILITHIHRDHVGGLAAYPDVPAYSPPEIVPGSNLQIGGLPWLTIDLAGHTPDGIGWYTEYHGKKLFFPGDSIFARSIGKCRGAEQLAMENILKAMNSLAPDTIICPGHGPATTVAEEWDLNPFIAPYNSFRKSSY